MRTELGAVRDRGVDLEVALAAAHAARVECVGRRTPGCSRRDRRYDGDEPGARDEGHESQVSPASGFLDYLSQNSLQLDGPGMRVTDLVAARIPAPIASGFIR